MKCVSDSFETSTVQTKTDNIFLKTNAKQWTEYGTLYWPSITINKQTFRGDITPQNILEAICATLWSKPKVCLDFYAEESIAVPLSNQNHNSVITWELLVIIVTFLLAVNMALIFVYRRCAKKELEKDVGFQVSAAVTQYIALS